MDIRRYIYSHCVEPKKVRIWDSYSQSYIIRELPCGKCLHCRNTQINEWVTRLTAQKLSSKYCYYVSLDYAPFKVSDPVSLVLARETAACYHNINKYHTYGMQPLVLCKNHLQDFFKRLRKNTGFRFQYFACGEYGTHADGRGFGRPHFHTIIFSNDLISFSQFERAWSIHDYIIGRVDFKDLSLNNNNNDDNTKIFKYVAKYLQKQNFDFEQLATIDFHRTYFKSINLAFKSSENLFKDPVLSQRKDAISWQEYIKLYSPFIVCSRRPSIGSAYFEKNLERFKKQDFRLFGLPKTCTAFPRYYVRRTKESLFDFRCIGEISNKPTTSSRMGYIIQILRKLYDYQVSIDNWNETACSNRCINQKGILKINIGDNSNYIPVSSLNFYDAKNLYFYQFDGYFYNVWCKLKDHTYGLLDKLDIFAVLSEIDPLWSKYFSDFIRPLHDKRVMSEKEFNDSIYSAFPETKDKSSFDLFRDEVYRIYQTELDTMYKTKLLMQNSKTDL